MAPDPVVLVERLVERGVVPGAALVVADADGVALEAYAGAAGTDPGAPRVGPVTRFALASLTKPLVALAALVAVEEGILDLDDGLAGIVPGVHPQITLRGCLSHTSGLPETVSPRAVAGEGWRDWPTLAAGYAGVAPVHPAGSRRLYSNVGYAVAGHALERASGMPVDAYLHAAVLEPLAMAGTSLGLPATAAAEAATVREPGLWLHGVSLFNDPALRALPLPHAGGYATAPDYAAFLRCVLRGGVAGDGTALVAPETAAELLANQGGALPGGVESFMTWPRADWAIGFELRDGKERHWTGTALSPRAGTHFGASGTLCFVDPERGLAAALLANRGTYSGWMLEPGAWPDIVAAIVAG